ncbi:MAG: dihydroorotate dehydrogenase electron transfer subunit, partial [Thermodesulfobacteriota bacterium]
MTAQQTVQIISNTTVSDGYFKIRVDCGFNYEESVPGQFVTLRIPGRTEPLLRRPFSINRLLAVGNNENLQMEILYRVVGGFTRQLSEMEPDDSIDMLGPVGRGFTVKRHSRPVALAAGGIGVAPLVFLADRLRQAGTGMDLVTVFLGGRTKADILCKDIFADLGADIRVVTEDGSAGQQGLVTDPVQAWMDESSPAMIYACGPDPMLKAVGE